MKLVKKIKKGRERDSEKKYTLPWQWFLRKEVLCGRPIAIVIPTCLLDPFIEIYAESLKWYTGGFLDNLNFVRNMPLPCHEFTLKS
jgi:hypothetical protein